MTATTIFILIAIFAAFGFAGRIVGLIRKSKEVEKTIDYSKMREWKDDEDD